MKHLLICLFSLLAPDSLLNAAERPNILLILADDLKYHDLGFTGSKDIPTPHIDALAKSGVFCSQAYCTAPLCAPSRAGLLTGRNQARFGFDFNPEPYVAESEGNRLQHPDRFKNGLPQSEKTIASYLKAAGYKTAWIGKWHLGEAEWAHPKTHGFEHCYGFLPGVQSYRPMTALEAKRAGDTPPLNNCLMSNGVWVKNTGNLTDMLGAEAARYIAATKDAPWFVYCAFNAPHGPQQPDPEREPRFAHITDDVQRRLTANISRLDDAMGAIMQSLRDTGQIGRTLVILASDNGISSVGEWGGGKGTMLEGGLRVPLFLSWPGTLAPNSMRDDRVSFLDLAPTVLAAASVDVTPAMKLEGTDLFATASIPNRPLAWRMDEAYAFRDEGHWKLVGKPGSVALYDLKTDPLEKKDLAAANPEKLAELTARWKKWDAENAPPMWKAVSEGAKKPTGAENRKKRETKKSPPEASATSHGDALASWNETGIQKHAPHSPLALDVTADFSFSVRFKLPTLADTTLFEWSTPPATKAARHFLALELIKPGNLPVPVIGAYINGGLLCGPADKLADGAWHTAVFRVTGNKKQFFLDGVIAEENRGERGPNFDLVQRFANQSDLHISKSGLVIGRDLRGKFPFKGNLDHLAFWNRALTDAEIGQLSGTDKVVSRYQRYPGYYELGGRFYDPKLTIPQRMEIMTRDNCEFYRRALKQDRYFPRIHTTIPGFATEPTTTFANGAYHVWPHGHIEWAFNPTHTWHHLMTRDLINYEFMPLPGWVHDRACNLVVNRGQGVTYTDNKHVKQNGVWQLGLQKWVCDDTDLRAWRFEKNIPLPLPPTGTPSLDYWMFEHQGKWHMLAACPGTDPVPGKQPTLELYRAADDTLSSWSYVGPFYYGHRTAHHPRLFFIEGKAVVFSDIAIDKGSQYQIGHLENDRFIKDSEGSFHFDETDGNPFGSVLTDATGRNLLWFWLRDSFWHEDFIARDAVRQGWLGGHSLPREITLKEGKLTFAPARELAGLRSAELIPATNLSLAAGKTHFPPATGAHGGQMEIQTSLNLDSDSVAGLLLCAGPQDTVKVLCNGKGEIALDLTAARRACTNTPRKRLATGRLPLNDGRVELRVFWDRSIMEVYANGVCTTAWWRPDDPASVQAGFFCDKGRATVTSSRAWRLGTIWKNYIAEASAQGGKDE